MVLPYCGSANNLNLLNFTTFFQLCLLVLHSLTTIIVFATIPPHRLWVFFYSLAIASLTSGWIAFALFLLQIYHMDENMNVASKLKSLLCCTRRSGSYDVTFDLRSDPTHELGS